MLDILYFILSQLYNLIIYLDSIYLFGTVSLYKLLVICLFVKFVVVILKRGNDK